MFRGASGAATGGRTNAKGRIKQIPGNCVPNTERRQNSTADIRLLKPACLLRASHCSGALTSAVTPGIPKTAGSSTKLTERTCKTQDLYSLVTFAQTERSSDLAQKQEGDSLSAAAGKKTPQIYVLEVFGFCIARKWFPFKTGYRTALQNFCYAPRKGTGKGVSDQFG